jgi:hypothetical protein
LRWGKEIFKYHRTSDEILEISKALKDDVTVEQRGIGAKSSFGTRAS